MNGPKTLTELTELIETLDRRQRYFDTLWQSETVEPGSDTELALARCFVQEAGQNHRLLQTFEGWQPVMTNTELERVTPFDYPGSRNTGAEPQDAAPPRGAERGNQRNSVSHVLSCAIPRLDYNDDQLDNNNHSPEARPLPGFEPPPPLDPWTDVAYGARR